MKALVYRNGKLVFSGQYPVPVRKPGESLVRVSMSGICNTDLEIMRGYMGFNGVLGHEFVGVVEESDDRELVGKRVVGEINCSCNSCPACLRGDMFHCPNRTTLGIFGRDGSMADYCVLPDRNLHPVPAGVSDLEAVFTEPLAAAVEITERSHIRPEESVVVIGDGKLGILVAQTLRLTGCNLMAVGRHQEKLRILKDMKIDTCLERDLPDDFMADVVVDCTGHPDGFALARRALRPRGRLILKSTFHGENSVNLTMMVVDEITLSGSRCGPFAPALRLLEMGLVSVNGLIEKVYPMEESVSAFEHAGRPGTMKILIDQS